MTSFEAARAGVTLALFLIGCGARSGLRAPADDTEETTTDASSPSATLPDECEGAPDPPPAAFCGPLQTTLAVQAACGVARPDCAPVDAEGFVSVQECAFCLTNDNCGDAPFETHRVLAMNRLGKGHLIAWCDVTTLVSLMNKLDAAVYLGGSAKPRVATVGLYPCSSTDSTAIPNTTYLGNTLPDSYQDGAALAADWDVLVACGASHGFGETFAPVVLSFVRDLGRGFLAAFDYTCPGTEPAAAFHEMNAVIGEAGLAFVPYNLGYGNGDVDIDCVADYPPP